MWSKQAALGFAFAMWGTSAACEPSNVTLTSADGGFEVSGDVIAFDGEFFILETIYGVLTIEAARVDCGGPGCALVARHTDEVTFSGSAVMAESLMPALVEDFARRNGYDTQRIDVAPGQARYTLRQRGSARPFAILRIHGTTTDEGFADLLAEEAQIVMARRSISPEEKYLVEEAGLGSPGTGPEVFILALDAVVPVVSPESPIQDISPADLAGILQGAIRNWSGLGHAPGPIDVHVLSGSDVPANALLQSVLRLSASADRVNFTVHDTYAAFSQGLKAGPNALGVAFFSEVGALRVLDLTGDCGRRLRVGPQSLKTGDYPYLAPLLLYTPKRRLPQTARAFLTYVQSAEAQAVILHAGYVDQSLETIALRDQGERLANAILSAGDGASLVELQRLVARLWDMERLTVTVRLPREASSSDMPLHAQIRPLLRALKSGAFRERQLLVIGFSDGLGADARTRRNSVDLAEKTGDIIRLAMGSASRSTLAVDAFGGAFPIMCDDTQAGRGTNARAEIWLRQR